MLRELKIVRGQLFVLLRTNPMLRELKIVRGQLLPANQMVSLGDICVA